MKRITIFTLLMAGCLLLAASCIRFEEQLTPSIGGGTIFTGVAERAGIDTKAELALYYDVVWKEGDKIYVTDGNKTDDIFIIKSGFNTNTGTFEGSKGISGDIEAFFPETLKTDGGYVWPAVQTNEQMPPMYAKQNISEDGSSTVNFSGLGALLRIAFSTNVEGFILKSITLQDAEKPLSGKFQVNANGQAEITDEGNAGVTLELGKGVALGMAAKYFNIAIPAGKYENITISFTTTNGFTSRKTSTTLPEIKRNSVNLISLASSDFHFNGGEDLLPGKFTIGAGPDGIAGTDDDPKVQFSRGNLRYILDPGTWCFANYDQSIDPDRSKPSFNDFTWGFGFWSTTDGGYGKWAGGIMGASFVDWGTQFGDGTFWRTPTVDEWLYLTHQRKCVAKYTVNLEEAVKNFVDSNPYYTIYYTLGYSYEDVLQMLLQAYGAADIYELAEKCGITYGEIYICFSQVTYNGIDGILLYPDDYEGDIINEGAVLTDAEIPYGCVFIPQGFYWTPECLEDDPITYWTGDDRAHRESHPHEARWYVRLVHDVTPITHKVTFDLGGRPGTPPPSITVPKNSKITRPEDPVAEDYVFRGWDWNFDNYVTSDITVTALWTPDALPGEFSVSPDRLVRFSPGNLYKRVRDEVLELEFEAGQQYYTRIITNALERYYFFWAADVSSSSVSFVAPVSHALNAVLFTNETTTTPKPDLTVNAQTGMWRTLSGGPDGEWDYLLNQRTMKHVGFRYTNMSQGTVIDGTTHKGLFIYPDNYSGKEIGNGGPDSWEAIKSAGIVYLPDVNYFIYNSSVLGSRQTEKTYYWSSTPDGTQHAYCLSFAEDEIKTNVSIATDESIVALRLVRDVKSGTSGSGTE